MAFERPKGKKSTQTSTSNQSRPGSTTSSPVRPQTSSTTSRAPGSAVSGANRTNRAPGNVQGSASRPRPLTFRDGQVAVNPALASSGKRPTTPAPTPARPQATGKVPVQPVVNPIRQQVGTVSDKATREALYALAATIEATTKLDPHQAQALQQQFSKLVKTKGITPQQVQRIAGGLFNQGQALADSRGVIQPPINGIQFGQEALKAYDGYIGNKKNTVLPGVGNLFGYRNPLNDTSINAQLSVILAGMVVGNTNGLKDGAYRLINKISKGELSTTSQSSKIKFTNSPISGPQSSSNSRSAGLRQIKYDLKIPLSQQPFKVTNDTLLTDKAGKAILDGKGSPIRVREYYYKTLDGKVIVIQEHSLGHQYGGQGDQPPHFNVRPIENRRTGSVPNTEEHYYFTR